MPAPFTIVWFKDEEEDEFPIRLPGVYRENRAADAEAALQILREMGEMVPRGEVKLDHIDYID